MNMTKEEALAKIESLKNYITELDNKKDIIYLLSAEEYEKYKDEIPPIKGWWWLRSPGGDGYGAALVSYDGSVYFFGDYVDYDYVCVRPALNYENLPIYESKKGKDYFIYNEVRWKIIDKENQIAISEMPIGYEKFDKESNNYETSYIRKWLLDWIKGAEE